MDFKKVVVIFKMIKLADSNGGILGDLAGFKHQKLFCYLFFEKKNYSPTLIIITTMLTVVQDPKDPGTSGALRFNIPNVIHQANYWGEWHRRGGNGEEPDP